VAQPSDSAKEGFQVLELLGVAVIVGVTAVLLLPGLLRFSRSVRLDFAASEVMGALRLARSHAVRYSTKVGVKFREDSRGRISFTIYRDGDGDGVLNRDIDSGVDPQLAPSRQLIHMGQQIRFGFPRGPAPRDPGDPRRRLNRLDDPIRFNRSDLASFNHLGGSTPGSVYLTDGLYHLAVVRVFGFTGKVKVMRYDPETETWK
jgi:hypothetical protein